MSSRAGLHVMTIKRNVPWQESNFGSPTLSLVPIMTVLDNLVRYEKEGKTHVKNMSAPVNVIPSSAYYALVLHKDCCHTRSHLHSPLVRDLLQNVISSLLLDGMDTYSQNSELFAT